MSPKPTRGQRGPYGPSKLTPELTRKICVAVRLGNYIETAAAFAGIAKVTLYKWMKLGAPLPSENETEQEAIELAPYREFSASVAQAMAAAEVRDVTLVARAAQTVWQAAAWRLERRNPERWGRRDRPEVPEGDVTPTGIVVLPPVRPVEEEVESQPLVH